MIPDGVYRSEISADELLDAGAPPAEASSNSGLRTLTVENGTFRFNLKNSSPDCTGTLTAIDGRTRFTEDQPPIRSAPNDPEYFDVSWIVEDDQPMMRERTVGEPRSQDVEALLTTVYTAVLWTIIG